MLTTADEARRSALRTELATILGHDESLHPTLSHVGVVEVGPQRALGCELYRANATGEWYAVGFAGLEARSVFRVAIHGVGSIRDVTLLEVVYDADAIRDVVAAFADVAGAGGRPEVRRRAIVELAGALGGASQLVVEMVAALALEREGA
jgi:hypothetical protein